MVEPQGSPSMRRQCELLGVNRSTLYYERVPPDAEDLALMRRIDEIHLRYPFYGSRKIARTLRDEGVRVNRKRVQRLMRLMGLESVAPKPNTSKPCPEHPVYPYLLGNLKVSRVNQAWAADITYISMARGFLFLFFNRRATQGQIQFTCKIKQAVAHDLRFHALGIHAPIVLVVRVLVALGRSRASGGRSHAVGVGGDHQAVDVFHAPTVFHQLDCQPIQQFRVRRRCSLAAKIKNRGD